MVTPGPTTTPGTTIPGTDYTMTDYISPDSSGTTYPPYDRNILSIDDEVKIIYILNAHSSLASSSRKIQKVTLDLLARMINPMMIQTHMLILTILAILVPVLTQVKFY